MGQLHNNQVRALCYMVQRATVGELPASAAMTNAASPTRSSTPNGVIQVYKAALERFPPSALKMPGRGRSQVTTVTGL